MKKRIVFVQQILKEKGLYRDKIDGIAGPLTLGAISSFPEINNQWSVQRRITAFIQLTCLEEGFIPVEVDGYWGPETEHVYDQFLYVREHGKRPEPWRPEEIGEKNPHGWPVQYTPEFNDFYGERGSHLTRIELPYLHRLSWNTGISIRSFYCHRKVSDSLLAVLTRVLEHYGPEEIRRLRMDLWGGCYNERPIRGGTRWSMHSWGIAVDYDPARNKLKWGRDQAAFAAPEYNDWWRFWEDEGWVSLGRKRNFDWMHVQAARI